MRDNAPEQVRRTSGASYLTIHNQFSDRKPRKQHLQADVAWGSHCQPQAVPHLPLQLVCTLHPPPLRTIVIGRERTT